MNVHLVQNFVQNATMDNILKVQLVLINVVPINTYKIAQHMNVTSAQNHVVHAKQELTIAHLVYKIQIRDISILDSAMIHAH